MAYRKNLTDDFGAVTGSAGGANAAINDAAFAAANADACKLIEVDPGIYEVSQTVPLSNHAKRFAGWDGNDVFNTASQGTVLDWWGGAAPMVKIAPIDTSDLIAPHFEGFQLRCNGVATMGVVTQSTRRMKLRHVQVVSPASVGFHFQDKAAGHLDVGSNYDADLHHLTANCMGSALGMVFDNLSGAVITCPHVTHQSGAAYFLRKIDTCAFINVNTSRHEGYSGYTLFFDGLQGTYVVGNRFFGLHCGGWPIGSTCLIYSRGDKARQNRIYGMDGVDTQPVITVVQGSKLYYDYMGGGYTPTLIGEKALDVTPKQQTETW
jgi:hypothetical protein